jgi:hypothetical protein
MNPPHTLATPSNRSLTKDMFPRAQRLHGKIVSRCDGRTDIHRVDSGVLQEVLVGGICFCEGVFVFCGEGFVDGLLWGGEGVQDCGGVCC